MITMGDKTIPDLEEIDDEILTYWEERASTSKHSVLRGRFADTVWDLKKRITGNPANVQYAQIAIDAYVNGITNETYNRTRPLAIRVPPVLRDAYSQCFE